MLMGVMFEAGQEVDQEVDRGPGGPPYEDR